jgi:acetyl-CoA C-acetyltransferase
VAQRIAILGGIRIPFCRAYSAYKDLGNKDMMIGCLSALVERYHLNGERLGDVALGATLKHSRDWNLARESVLGSGLAPETPAYDLQRACGTSLSATNQIGAKVALKNIEVGIAGGVDSISDIPLVYGDKLRKTVIESGRAKTMNERIAPWLRLRPKDFKPAMPGVTEPRTGLSMGEHCERMAKEWQIPRQAQDELALESQQKAAQAWKEGFYDDLVVPFHGQKKDNNVRPDANLDKMSRLKPAFDKSGSGTLTAGNSTPLTDGAAAVLVGSEDWAKAHELPVQACLTHFEVAAVDFVWRKEGLLMAPAYAIPRMLDRAGLTLQDFDFYEIHEAFAAQVLCVLKAWESEEFCRERLGREQPLGSIDRSKLNVKGGSVAIGHPFGATGARIVATAAKLLNEKGSGRCLIGICTGGGMGVAAILEHPEQASSASA